MAKIFAKDPDEVLDFSIDWNLELASLGSPEDTISASVWTVPTGITEGANAINAGFTTVFLSGGTAGETYIIHNQITTDSLRVYERSIAVQVRAVTDAVALSGAVVVEDGTIVAGANSYISRNDAGVYHANRNNTEWFEALPVAQDAALIKATDWLVQKYRKRWKGVKVNTTQTLDWPRAGVQVDDGELIKPSFLFDNLAFTIPEDEVPDDVKNAQAELALRVITTSDGINPDLDALGNIKRLKLKAGSVEKETEYFASSGSESAVGREQPIFSAVEDIIRPYLRPRRRKAVRG
jgi:hypothetical protein